MSQGVALSRERFRIHQCLEQLCAETGGRIIKPYFRYIPRAKLLFPNETEKKARGLYRGYVKQLIDLGLLMRIATGVYFKPPVNAQFVQGRKSGEHQTNSRKPFTVLHRAPGSLRDRLKIVTGEMERVQQELESRQKYLSSLHFFFQELVAQF